MNIKISEDLPKKQTELEKNSQKEENLKPIKDMKVEFSCAFYDKCTLPKSESLCNQFPDFMICPDYIVKRNKILNEK